MKRVWPVVVVVAAVLVCFYYADRAFQAGAKLKAAKAEYAELKKVTLADHAVQQGVIAGAEAKIAEKDEVIGHMTKTIAAKQAELDRLAALVAQPVPPSTPDVEALPTVVALRAQVVTLNAAVVAARGVIADQREVITAWEGKYAAQVDISEAWHRQYEGERALRIAAEEMFKLSERRRGAYGLAAKAAIVVAGAAVIYGLSK